MMATQAANVMGLPAAWATALETLVKNLETDIATPKASHLRITLSLNKSRSGVVRPKARGNREAQNLSGQRVRFDFGRTKWRG